MVLIIAMVTTFFLSILFFWGPDILYSVAETLDEWRDVFEHIRDRRDEE